MMNLVNAREKKKELINDLKEINSKIKIIDDVGEEITKNLELKIIAGLKNIGFEKFSIEISQIYSEEGPYVSLFFDSIILFWNREDFEMRPRNCSSDSQKLLFTLNNLLKIDEIIRQSIISV